MYLIRESIYRRRRVPSVLWPDTDPNPGNDRAMPLIRIREGKARAIALVTVSIRDGGRWLRVERGRGGGDVVTSADRFALRFREGDREISRPLRWSDLEPLFDEIPA